MPRRCVNTIVCLLAIAASSRPAAAQQGQLDSSESLFTVLAAINAAGYDAGLESPSGHPLRKALREEIARRRPPSAADMRGFMARHRQEDANWELRQYISYALLVDPPDFKFRILQHQLPPDVAALEGLGELMARFHKEAGIAELYKLSQPAFEEVLARYHPLVMQAVTEVNAYLRNVSSSASLGRRFQIYVDLLGAPNQVHFRSYLDEYFIVLTASSEPRVDAVREAYLHFLLDPLATKYAAELEEKKAVGDYALGSPLLADHYKQDFLLLATKSLVRAMEARLTRGEARRREMVEKAMKEGFVLAAHFAEQLPLYEKQEQAMRLYFPELIKNINFRREEARMENFQFETVRQARAVKTPPPPPPVAMTGAAASLEEAENLYRNRDLEKARELYLRVLEQTDRKPLHAKAYYGLARVAALNRNPELADKLFRKVLDSEPDAADRAWALVYLGRLSDAAGEREQAAGHYRAALGVSGASQGARQAAEAGLKQSFAKDK